MFHCMLLDLSQTELEILDITPTILHNHKHQPRCPSSHPLDHPPLPPKPGVQLLQLPQEPFVRTDKPMSTHLKIANIMNSLIQIECVSINQHNTNFLVNSQATL